MKPPRSDPQLDLLVQEALALGRQLILYTRTLTPNIELAALAAAVMAGCLWQMSGLTPDELHERVDQAFDRVADHDVKPAKSRVVQ
jgi:hypothetical protein